MDATQHSRPSMTALTMALKHTTGGGSGRRCSVKEAVLPQLGSENWGITYSERRSWDVPTKEQPVLRPLHSREYLSLSLSIPMSLFSPSHHSLQIQSKFPGGGGGVGKAMQGAKGRPSGEEQRKLAGGWKNMRLKSYVSVKPLVCFTQGNGVANFNLVLRY